MRRLAALLAVLALLAAGCAGPRSGALGPAPTAAPPPVPPPSAPTFPSSAPTSPSPSTDRPPVRTPPAPSSARPDSPGPQNPTGTVDLELWFVRDGTLAFTRRSRPATVATSRLALAELAAGPTPPEAAAGLTTLVPAGIEVARITDGTATVVPPATFAEPDPRALRLARAQVVWTLTQFPTVRRVAFTGDGADVVLSRPDLTDLLAPIVVTSPVIGQRVTAPVTVAGTADVYEATVSVRVLDRAGRVVGTGFTTASCGTGCRGVYRFAVAWRATPGGPGTVEVYEVSPRDGSRQHVVSVPVLLAATG
ncbi:Gmad2 immunoglobulin-like domain-containing protein [Micromonospora sp. CPCC 205711]|uniref:Gmad2 immunoglobulin-like domain-containing protein n=1 Tax=Micromonospora sp. CPCC 205547 TaxID=3122400 RepID=UPI002FF2B4A0